MRDHRPISKMLFMTGGLLVWGIHFTIIYGFTTVACTQSFSTTRVFGAGIVPVVVAVATMLAWTATGAILVSALSGPIPPRSARFSQEIEYFLQYLAAIVAILALVAIAWNALPALIFAPC